MPRLAARRRYAAPHPFVRHPAQLELFDRVAELVRTWRPIPEEA